MKTSVIEVHDMLAVLSLDEVESRVGEVPGVESVTVNYAAGSATVRYDETRLKVGDIKSAIHLRANEPASSSAKQASEGPEDAAAPASPAVTPVPASAPKPSPDAPATAPTSEPKPEEAAPASVPKPDAAPSAPNVADHKGHAAPDGQPAKSAEMAHEMGHGGGKDLPTMVRDMRNRFWICLAFSVPIFVYAPMGGLFAPPAPPFGLELNLWLFFLATAAVLYPSWPFFVAAWRALRNGVLNMAVLVVLSVGTGYLFSVGATFFFKSDQFFEAVAVLLVFILLGHWLEMRARSGASTAITALMDLAPPKANVFR
jgi:Cu2+-exporting ATPase